MRRKVNPAARGALRAAAMLLFLAGVAAGQQDRMAQLKADYDRATDPVPKARALAKLGPAQMEKVRQEANAGEAGSARGILEQYRDEVREVSAALTATGINAERHSNGFKQLQISLRESVRKLDEVILNLPYEQRDSFEAIRKELDRIDKELVHELFPRQGPGKPPRP